MRVPLLPAFLSFYVGTDDTRLPSAASRVAQGLQIGLLVTAGFLGVFTLIGLPAPLGANVVARVIPWVGLVVGALLVVVGATALAGHGLGEQPILWDAYVLFDDKALWNDTPQPVAFGEPIIGDTDTLNSAITAYIDTHA